MRRTATPAYLSMIGVGRDGNAEAQDGKEEQWDSGSPGEPTRECRSTQGFVTLTSTCSAATTTPQIAPKRLPSDTGDLAPAA